MYKKKVSALSVALIIYFASVDLYPQLTFADPDFVAVTTPKFVDSNGNVLTRIQQYQQAQIFLEIRNNQNFDQTFVAIVEIRDAEGVTQDIQWKGGTLSASDSKKIFLSWTADDSSEVTVRAFVVSDFQNPIILSPATTSSFQISSEIDSELPIEDLPSDNPVISEPISDYTVLVYMVGSDLESSGYSATDDIVEMASVGSTDSVNIIIETGGADAQPDEYRFIDFTTVQRYKVAEGAVEQVSDLGSMNMGDPSTLSDFIEWGVQAYPADKYAIILWDHGNGINGFGSDELYGDLLTLDELESAFAEANESTSVNFELIGFDACLMATVEVANRLHPYGNYLVASEEIEPGWGWDYSAIFSSLNQNPFQTGDKLGTEIADSYVAHIEAMAGLYDDYDSARTITLSVVNLSQIPLLHNDVQLLAENLDEQVVSLDSSYSFARAVDNTEKYAAGARTSSAHVDLYHLASNIESEFQDYSELTEQIKNSIDDAVVYKVSGDLKPNANGISIYMPTRVDEFNPDYILYTLSGWEELLEQQETTLQSDTDAPDVNLEFDGENINGNIEGEDIAKVVMFVSSELYDNTRYEVLSYLEVEPEWAIEPDGSFEFAWNKQIISLCNEDYCSPTLMNIESSEDTLLALFPVELQAENFTSPVTLIYEVNSDENDDTTFDFLGAWPEIDEEGTVSRELWPLFIGDKISTYTYEYDLEDENYFNYLSYESIEVTENFRPEYFEYPGTYYLQFAFCDYSDNCSYSEEYQFTTGEPPAVPTETNSSGNPDIQIWLIDPIVRGNEQTITIQVFDEDTNYIIEDAYVKVDVVYASEQTTKTFDAYTDENGEVAFTWRIGGNSDPGTFEVFIDAEADGYESESYTSSFEVVPAS